MMDIYIYDKKIENLSVLREICFKYLMVENFDAEIYCFSDESLILATAIYMLPMCADTECLSRKLKKINRENYIVVLLDRIEDFRKAVTPGIAPSGLLIRPWCAPDVKALLDELYSDYKRSGTEPFAKNIFRFRQKSREFSIPYERILYFESRSKRIAIRTDTQEFEFYDTLENVLENAPSNFMRIHKSFAINLSRIVSVDYGAMTVEFDDGSTAYMSRTYKKALKERLVGKVEQNAYSLYT